MYFRYSDYLSKRRNLFFNEIIDALGGTIIIASSGIEELIWMIEKWFKVLNFEWKQFISGNKRNLKFTDSKYSITHLLFGNRKWALKQLVKK